MNDDFFTSLTNRKVQDLYWLLFKTSPLKSCPDTFEIALFPEEIITAWEINSKDYFRALDKSPSSLEVFVDRKKNYRLGFYAEALLSYFFQSFPGIQLLIQNFQITVDKKTIGEIDYVIEWENRVLHIELAVKYYLLLPKSNPNIAENWVGPSKKDNLHKKLTKIEGHQIPLGKHKILKDALPGLQTSSIESFFLFRGQFFKNDLQSCDYLNREPLDYFFWEEFDDRESEFEILDRPDWLGSIDRITMSGKPFEKGGNRPLMVKLKTNKVCFIVPDDWND